MTPAMAASQVVLGRKTQVIEDSLRRNWPWGTRFSLQRDDREEAYIACYMQSTGADRESLLAKELIARKRERATLEALEDLVRYLRTIREERKAILTVTEGWLLYGAESVADESAEGPRDRSPEPIPGVDPVGVGPNGKLTTKDPRNIADGFLSKNECDTDRMRLAMLDNKRFFMDLMDEANFANASFYPVDPRGLPVFDNPIGPAPPPPIVVDAAMLRQRIEVMKTLALNTDGLAVTDSNDLDKGMRRISDDLTSYYLLGYYSTNAKLDGRFRSLKVKVKQPGVEVRARRGYRAATEEEVNSARRAADAPVPEATRAVNAAIDRLGRVRPEARFRINAVASTGVKPPIWIAGELQSAAGRPDDFAQGGTVDIDATGATSRRPRGDAEAGRTHVPPDDSIVCRRHGRDQRSRTSLDVRRWRDSLVRHVAARHGLVRCCSRCSSDAASRPAIGCCRQPTCASAALNACGWNCQSMATRNLARASARSSRAAGATPSHHRRTARRGERSALDHSGRHPRAAGRWRLRDRDRSCRGSEGAASHQRHSRGPVAVRRVDGHAAPRLSPYGAHRRWSSSRV